MAGLIGQLGPKAETLCQALWDVHCTALAAHSRQPMQAAAFFNYGLLPTRRADAKKPAL